MTYRDYFDFSLNKIEHIGISKFGLALAVDTSQTFI